MFVFIKALLTCFLVILCLNKVTRSNVMKFLSERKSLEDVFVAQVKTLR